MPVHATVQRRPCAVTMRNGEKLMEEYGEAERHPIDFFIRCSH